MYDIIYDYLMENIYNGTGLTVYSSEVMGVQTSMAEWLGHTTTIVLMVVVVVLCALFVRWVWRFVSGAFTLR